MVRPQQGKRKIGRRAPEHIRQDNNARPLVEAIRGIIEAAHRFRHFLSHINADGAAIAQRTKNELRRPQHGRAIIGMSDNNNADMRGLFFCHVFLRQKR